jgi:alpha,alpha-trehalase
MRFVQRALFLASLSLAPLMAQEAPAWPKARADAYMREWGWLRGANFQPSTAINQLEMWQAATFDPATLDRELGWAEGLGMNAMRVFLHHLAWEVDPAGFKRRVAQYLDIAAKHHQGTIFVFFDDCWNANYQAGPQPAPVPGKHNSGWVQDPGAFLDKNPAGVATLEAYVKDMLRTFGKDRRIVMWDLYNEPGNGGRLDGSLPLLRRVFTWAREAAPSQPLTVGVWDDGLTNLNAFQLEHSDVVTYHNYHYVDAHRAEVARLKSLGRPMVCTEYLARRQGSLFQSILPMLKENGVGAINWGFVSGRTNTIFAWDHKPGSPEEPELWFHDILRKDGTPFSAEEVRFYRDLTGAPAPLSSRTPREVPEAELQTLRKELAERFDRLRPQSIRPAEGFIKQDYLIPAGFYKQMWDWDGFFIGYHLCSIGKPEYLKGWVLAFAACMDAEGYIPGCVTTQGPRPVFGKFAMKPFLAQGAYLSARALNDFTWLKPVFDTLVKSTAYRERTQMDPATGLFFWENAGQSGADNTVVLSNDPNEAGAILGVDINTFQYRDYLALAAIAKRLGRTGDAERFAAKAATLRTSILTHLWEPETTSFWNVRRRDGRKIRRVSYSNFVPLIQKDLVSEADARTMIRRYLWNDDHMLAPHGLRSLSRQDADFNNENIIVPYSNWQGPVWINANFLHFVALRNAGFHRESRQLAAALGAMLIQDIDRNGSMHENYDGDTGAPLAPTAAQSKDGVFTGFVGWNLLEQNMLEAACDGRDLGFDIP